MKSNQPPWAASGQALADLVRVRIRGSDYTHLREHLVRLDEPRPVEHAAYLVAGTHEYAQRGQNVLEYLIRSVQPLNRDEYLEQGSAVVRFDDTTIRSMMRGGETADEMLDDMAVLMCHSHPCSEQPQYSGTDDTNEPAHMAALTGHLPGPHGSLVFGAEGVTGRTWSPDVATIRTEETAAATPIDEIVVFQDREFERLRPTDSRLGPLSDDSDAMRDRQALLHSSTGNQRIRESHVAVVGGGGLGSLIVQSLAHLGVGELTVVDPDVIETSNRSRVVGAESRDAGPPDATFEEDGVVPAAWAEAVEECGTPKVEVLGRLVSRIDPNIHYHGIHEEVQAPVAFDNIVAADMIISGTDTATSRRLISEAAQQYLRPLFNVGTDIDISDDDKLQSIATGFHVSGVNRPCLDCMGEIDQNRIDAEGKDEENLEYGMEFVAGEQPSVITINQEPAQRVTFAVHRYLTGLLADRHGFRTGTHSFTSNRFAGDTEANPECGFCNGIFTGAGDRGVPLAKDGLYRTSPTGVETGVVSELGLLETPEARAAQVEDNKPVWSELISRSLSSLRELISNF